MAAWDDVVTQLKAIVLNLSSLAQMQSDTAASFGVNVVTFGADPTGTADSTGAIQAAIDSLPARGGNIYFPAGNYTITDTIEVGDGTASTASSKWGVALIGEGSPVTTTDGDLSDGGSSTSMLTWRGTAGSSMVNFNGPLNGWGLRHLGFNGRNSAGYCVQLLDAAYGHGTDLTFRGATATNLRLYGQAPVISQGCSYNYFDRVWVAMTGGDSHGIDVDSVAGSFFNCFMKVRIVMPGAGPGGVARYGVYLGWCDSIFFFDLSTTTQNAANHSIVFDYTNGVTFPNSCGFVATDTSGIPMLEINAPAGGIPSDVSQWFFGFSRGNGMAPPPFESVIWFENQSLKTRDVGVGVLDTPSAGLIGARSIVNNCGTTVFNAIATTGGANVLEVLCDGSNWRIS